MKKLEISQEQIEKWRRMESGHETGQRMTRKQIASVEKVSGATVTRKLGAVMPYRGKRAKETENV